MPSNFLKPFRLLFICVWAGQFQPVYAQQHFSHDFAPAEAFIKPQEHPERDGISLNGSWRFFPVADQQKLSDAALVNPQIPEHFEWENTLLKVPSPWNVNSFAADKGNAPFVTFPGYPKKWESVKAGWLMRKLPYKKEWRNKRLILRFEAVAGYAQIFINRHKVAENFDVFLPFELDVTDQMKEGQENELLVWVASAQLFNKPGKFGRRTYVGGSFWGQHIIGIWQDVDLLVKSPLQLKTTFIKPVVSKDELNIEVTIKNESAKRQQVTLTGHVLPWINLAKKDVIGAPEPKWKSGQAVAVLPSAKLTVEAGAEKTIHLKIKVNGRLKTWSPDAPNLYGLLLNLNATGKLADKQYTRFGWREFTLAGSKLNLNGSPIVLKGDSWHFMGIPQMTRRYAWAWFKMLKDNHANAVRLHAQPYPQFYMDMADEMGICVLDETGMWASDGGPKIDDAAYWKNSEDHLKRLILRDRNHPSVFGWSVCNENLPVVRNVFHAPDSLLQEQIRQINNWVRIAKNLDPTRSWISGDGETDAQTDLPTVIGHYGNENSYKKWAEQGKVWGIGESGMAYYATPRQSAVYNGDRSYESQQGRMEGVADEAAQLLALQKKYGASYLSVFNLVWYGLKPLELGLKDTTRAPVTADGIFFGPYQEGKPGVQPERLGPYTTTLNPGYDPSLPLYSSWPLLDAISQSFNTTDTATVPKYKTLKPAVPKNKTAITAPEPVSVLLLSADKDSVLYHIFENLGVRLVNKLNNNEANLLIIDGMHAPGDQQAHTLQKAVLQKGGNVLLWGVDPSVIKTINTFLPQPLLLTDRKATSFIIKKDDAFLSQLWNADFYFSELSEKPIMYYGLTGDFVSHGNVLLEASNTDWQAWNKKAEYIKTSALIRTERESKPAGGALVKVNAGKGGIYVFSIAPLVLYQTAESLLRSMLSNLGISFQPNSSAKSKAINKEGVLENALVIGSFDIAGKTSSQIEQLNFLTNMKEGDYFAGKKVDQHFWQTSDSKNGQFDFHQLHFNGPEQNAVAYISFWVYSPRSLSNLLLEPDMPRLDLQLNADDGAWIFLNNKLISPAGFQQSALLKALPLEKGWNHFLIKSVQKEGAWKLGLKFNCDQKVFFENEIKSRVTQ